MLYNAYCMNKLTDKKCIPCSGDEPTLTQDKINGLLQQIDSGWEQDKDPDKIVREIEFKDFKEAVAFLNKVAEVAEEEGHHPDICVHDYNQVKVELWTHKIKGLHENDFIMASKIDRLA